MVARNRDPWEVRLPAARHPGDAGILPAMIARKRDPWEVRLPAAQHNALPGARAASAAYPKTVDEWVELRMIRFLR